jgi:AraC-like DNA-binding protein
VWIQHEGSRAFVADANIVPLYNAGHPYRRRPISNDGDRTDWFGVDPTILREVLKAHDPIAADAESRLFRFDYGRVTQKAFLRQRDVFTHVRSLPCADVLYTEESVIGVLDAMLSGLYGLRAAVPITARHRDLAEAAKASINRGVADQGGLGALARSIGTSVFHLCRVFREYSGSTLHRYRSDLRMRRSLELLDDAGDDILEIAVTLGYSGHSHFTGAFHRAFGMTPSQYRDSSRNQRADLLLRRGYSR